MTKRFLDAEEIQDLTGEPRKLFFTDKEEEEEEDKDIDKGGKTQA